jgi:ribulose-phosphate 3-epimerase
MAGPSLRRLLEGGPRLTVGMITADLLRLGDELALLETAGVELVHVDVMDGVFCPMLTVGPPVIRAMRTGLLKDAHLMIDDPLATIDQYVAAGADMITFQVEGARQPHRVLQVLGTATNANDPERGIVRGVAVNPSTSLEVVRPLLGDVEYVLVLAVNPGWGGQGFIASTEGRLEAARRMIEDSGREILLGVDGGVTRANIDRVARMGADVIVSGSAIFDGKAAAANAAFMLDQVRAVGTRPTAGARPAAVASPAG